MRTLLLSLTLLTALTLFGGCESKWGTAALGGAGGAAAGVGGYEWHFNREKDAVEEAYKAGKIDQRERDIRLDQIKRDSLFQK